MHINTLIDIKIHFVFEIIQGKNINVVNILI